MTVSVQHTQNALPLGFRVTQNLSGKRVHAHGVGDEDGKWSEVKSSRLILLASKI